jgi:hypothetical protein
MGQGDRRGAAPPNHPARMQGILDRRQWAPGRVSAPFPAAAPGARWRFAKALRPLLGWLGGAKPLRYAFAALAIATPALAQGELRGTWRGGYVCGQGHTALALTIEPRKDGTLSALFHFEAASDNPGVPTGCFEMQGRFDAATGRLALAQRRWLRRPPNYLMVDLEGQLSGDRLHGFVLGPSCTTFELERRTDRSDGAACRSGAPLLSLR